MKKFAIVTGASKGLGRAFALELGSRGINTILVSLPGEDIHLLNQEIISTYETSSVFFEVDLSQYDNVISFSKSINEMYSIFLLINNAGIGGTMKFGDAPVNLVNKIIQLNIMAVAVLTRQLIPNLTSQTQSFVLNISSLAAFNPVGYKMVYPASKAFVDSFTKGMSAEYRDSNVFFSVINPGAMPTNDAVVDRILKQGWLGRITQLLPQDVARKSLNKLFQKKQPHRFNPISELILSVLPSRFKLPFLAGIVKREFDKP
ncbi:MAG: SDR family NAD(P)-dependent oxidoreductase [Bacteroidetes bacterium]|nr:SDR family NAD(P)-dependent oxidoreductase [Bacteroidota bacterium]MDA1224681.1 SDR family NAD(P)-dependent oxidoreductase [Bacteroidota bacterium]